jgi:hypothetical protein
VGRSFRNLVFVLMAIAVLYVLVSPLVPTPNALSKNQQVSLAVIAPLMALFTVPSRPSQLPVVETSELFRSAEVIELTCSRLC